MSDDDEQFRVYLENVDFEGWETDALDIEELQEVDVDITDLMIHLLNAYKKDEVHILNDAKTQSILIIIPALEVSE